MCYQVAFKTHFHKESKPFQYNEKTRSLKHNVYFILPMKTFQQKGQRRKGRKHVLLMLRKHIFDQEINCLATKRTNSIIH